MVPLGKFQVCYLTILTILFPLSISGKLTDTLSVFIARVKPAHFGLLCDWRDVPILRQQNQRQPSSHQTNEHGWPRSGSGFKTQRQQPTVQNCHFVVRHSICTHAYDQ
jgi:hypothetical protein